jgi:hypothetical protein
MSAVIQYSRSSSDETPACNSYAVKQHRRSAVIHSLVNNQTSGSVIMTHFGRFAVIRIEKYQSANLLIGDHGEV